MTDAGISNAVDQEKLMEIDQLLRGSDAGKVEYDDSGNAIFNEDSAADAYKKALAGEKDANGLTEETPVETEVQTQETAEIEPKEPPKQETAEAEEGEPEGATPTWDDTIEIPLPDGRDAVTLGQMKDEFVALVRNRESVEKQSNDLATERLVINEILANPQEVSPERIEQLKQMNQQMRAKDVQTISEMYPQWTDNEFQRQQDFTQMMATGRELGATEVELKSITRPWIIHMLKTLSDYKAREAKAKQGIRKAKAPTVRDGKIRPRKEPTGRGAQFTKALNAAAGNPDGADWAALDKAMR